MRHKICDTERKLNTFILYLFYFDCFLCVYGSVGSGDVKGEDLPWKAYYCTPLWPHIVPHSDRFEERQYLTRKRYNISLPLVPC